MLICSSAANAELNSKQRLRAFARLPDWSGLWEQFNLGPSGAPTPADAKVIDAIMNEHPPYNAQWEAKFHAAKKARLNSPEVPLCTLGFPTLMMNSPLMFQAIVTPEETTLIFSQRETRHIYTDGRTHTPKEDSFETPWGDSVGHWEGQTLVVETVATSSFNIPDDRLSEDAKYIERIHMVDKNTLENQITVDDPVALTTPWRMTRQYHRVPNMNRIVEEDCQGNERNPVVNGVFTLTLPKP